MFAKVFQQIFDSSIADDPKVRRMFIDMLILADPSGVVDMTYAAIIRRTGIDPEEVRTCIARLMEPDPASRSGKSNGARLVFIDSGRDWGWRIVNYDTYRQMRDEEGRRAYSRDYNRQWMRDKRKKEKRAAAALLEQQMSNKSHNGQLNGNSRNATAIPRNSPALPSVEQSLSNKTRIPSVNVVPALNTLNNVEPCLAQEEEDEEEERVPSAVSLKGDTAARFITETAEAKRLICAKILNGKHPGRLWSPDAESKLATMCQTEGGIPLQEIEDIAWYRSLPPNSNVPELKRRSEFITETTLMNYWGDEAHRAAELRKKFEGPPPKPEPPRWREFMYWKADGAEINLPPSFFRLPRIQRDQYYAEFQTFEKQMSEERGVSTKAVAA